MALASGTRVGIYEVTAKIGEGGMGEVYQARDTTLDRDVALKVLPEAFTADPERLARFQREAKVLASLNHSNIGAIYGLEAAGDTQALVLELIEGPTLADRIAEGPISVDEALTIANQIAEALEAAHEQGIVHRDLKPANVKVKADGTVKVLDFGLAKAVSSDASGASATASATMSITGATQMGMVIGTAAYMAPEQARGNQVDQRADVWAFGVVLYEMLTGRKAFPGDDVSDTLATVLKSDPEWDVVSKAVPDHVHQVLRASLEKDQKQRLHHMADVRLAMAGAFKVESIASIESLAKSPLKVWQRPIPAAMAVSIAVFFTGFSAWQLTRSDSMPANLIATFSVPASSEEDLTEDVDVVWRSARHLVALSPDGSQIVYAANNQLYLRRLGQLGATVIPGTESGTTGTPFISPDGEWIGFFANRQLQKVAMGGGAPVTLADTADLWGATWGADDTILFGQGPEGLWRVPGAGGTPEVVVTVGEGEAAHGPQMLPGNEWVLFSLHSRRAEGVIIAGARSNWDSSQVVAQSVETGERRVLVDRGTDGRYLPTGHLVYAVDADLFAVPFDSEGVRTTGGPVSVVEGVAAAVQTGGVHFSVANNGSLLYVPDRGVAGGADRFLVWVDREGREELVTDGPDSYMAPRVSPDGTRIVVGVEGENSDIWTVDLRDERGNRRFTFDVADDLDPLWTPDGEHVVFSSGREAGGLFRRPADGTGEPELLVAGSRMRPYGWTDDGQLVVLGVRDNSSADIGVAPLDSVTEVTWLLAEAFGERRPSLSPDGRWLAYQSHEARRQPEIVVRPFPNVEEGRWQISSEGGEGPLWSRDGRELFYRAENKLMVTRVETGTTFDYTTPDTLFDLSSYEFPGSNRNYDISPEGERFLFLKTAGNGNTSDSRPSFVVTLNWFEELKERVPIP